MSNKKTKVTARILKLKMALSGLLLMVFIISLCPVKKGIQFLLAGNSTTETSNSSPNKQVNTENKINGDNLALCSFSGRAVMELAGLQITKPVNPVLPSSFILVFFISALPFVLRASYLKSFFYHSPSSLLIAGAPLYLKNRLLLI